MDIAAKKIIYAMVGAVFLVTCTAIVWAILKHEFLADPVSAIVGWVVGYLVAVAEEDSML